MLFYNIAIAMKTRMWCRRCLQLQPVEATILRVWPEWRCLVCGRERPQRLPALSTLARKDN